MRRKGKSLPKRPDRRNFDTVFTNALLECGPDKQEDPSMDVLMIVSAAGFFLLSGWLISLLDRL
jgi:hypothetical protein